jgi:transcriptional regulator with XRE-family HTH domain
MFDVAFHVPNMRPNSRDKQAQNGNNYQIYRGMAYVRWVAAMNNASLQDRAARRQNTDTDALYRKIERRLHTMHLSARKASLLAGLPPDGIRTIARGRIPRTDKLKALADVLGVDLNWFDLPESPIDTAISDREEAKQPELSLVPARINPELTQEARMLDQKFRGMWEAEIERVTELDTRTARGGDLETAVSVIDWGLPRNFVARLLPFGAGKVRIIHQAGDSMTPTIQPGQCLMVDIDDRTPDPPGLFAVWDGMSVSIRRLEYVPMSNPPMIRVMRDNQRYSSQEVPLSDLRVCGRVVMTMQPM